METTEHEDVMNYCEEFGYMYMEEFERDEEVYITELDQVWMESFDVGQYHA